MISVLFVDSEDSFLKSTKQYLEKGKEYSVDTAESAESALEKLHTTSYDAIISEYQMPGMDGIEFLKALRTSGDSTPFLLFTWKKREEVVIRAFEHGADFYIRKGGEPESQYAVLMNRIRMAVRRKKAENAVYQSEERFRSTMDHLPGTTWSVDRDLRYTLSRGAGLALLGLEPDQVLGMTLYEYFGTSDPSHPAISHHLRALAGETVSYDFTWQGNTFRTTLSPLYDPAGDITGVSGLAIDITEYRKMEEEVSAAHEQLAASEQELRHRLDEISQRDQLLQENNERLQLKINSILSPGFEIDETEFANIIDSPEIQSMMDDFYSLTHMGVAILDLKGNILVATGWQDICTKFHRVNEQSRRNCTESDLYLTQNVSPGQYLTYKCRNNMWDMVTPIIIGQKHIGNLFLGQFFFDDEVPDRALFAEQAEKFGFDREEYLAALDRVPRWSREKVDTVMCFYTKFASMISRLSYSNVNLVKALLDNQRSMDALARSEERYRIYTEYSPVGIFVVDRTGRYIDVNPAACRMLGYDRDELLRLHITDISPADRVKEGIEQFNSVLLRTGKMSVEALLKKKDGTIISVLLDAISLPDDRFMAFCTDISDNKEAEAALRESEERYRGLVEASPDIIWKVDPQGNFTYISPQCTTLLGYSPDELIGTSMLSLIRPESVEWVRNLFLSHIEEQSLFNLLEVPAYHRDGRPLVIEIRSVLIPDDQEKVTGFQGIARDITERKQAEEALRESEELYRGLVDTITSGVAIYEVHGDGGSGKDYIIKTFNRMALDIEGKTIDEVIGKSLLDLRPTIDEYGLIPVFQRVWKSGNPEYYPQKIYIDEKYASWYENRIFRLQSGEIVAVYNDVTDLKRFEEALRESEERYREFFTTSRDCVFITSPEGHWIDFNETSLEMFGYASREELMALPLTQLYEYPEDREKFIARIIQEGYVRDYPVRLRKRDGTVIDALVTAVPVRNTDGSIKALIGSMRDITERKAAVEALRESEKNYKNLVENISDVLFSISPDGVITYLSPVVSKFGITADKVVGRPVRDFVLPDDYPMVEKAVSDVLSGKDVPVEFRIRNPAGVIFHVLVSARPEWKDGKITGIAGIMKDITSIKDLERLKVEALQQIEENLIEMAILNDQIRNPLAVIMAAADLAGGSTAEDIIRQVQEIDAMINTIDRKWIESEKVREFLLKYYGVKGVRNGQTAAR